MKPVQSKREHREEDQDRLAELYLELLNFDSFGATVDEKLQRIEDTIRKALRTGISVREMLDLVKTEQATREFVAQSPKLFLDGYSESLCNKILERIVRLQITAT